ncbi:two component, sigma54 specific, transcriptional regulator, Fis family [Desulfobulbus propionicus DSM 2032]|jgi:two-component system NtrC family response regulator|uniref:Two component, sigma54 specific, transcriptional regulator, Fis family n=1 Tax=Desulfobulbus propionicus (strain ATCC 33891 / DSM 2032 / VKM B-1956 / 1pr3) TaxID=577650 RepID=A0A7U3YMK1_DESPD|nr:sigma-54 dependent transcriptional regulator [Desulfobulbus propionicus]ADW18153.1 two component, sigma54 specific, transcriptional regulator, Fis family [Desulfobulbus propionicus DSM 2032]
MDKERYSILVVDDEESIRRLLQKELANSRREILTAADGAEALAMIRNHWFDVIIMDLWLPDVSDLELLIKIRESIPHIEVIMITGHGDVDIAVEAMKLGACDFIRKPFNLDRLDLIVEKAHQRVLLSRENAMLRHSTGQAQNQVRFIGNSQAIRDIQFLIDKVAPAKIPVLITGESGAGKDVVARLIHQRSPLAANPMIVKNCATLQKELARSELFGHIKGSFTGANESREGLLSFAHDSTLFLDEIGELPLEVQASLLRVLETGTYRRVGEKEERKVNIRFLFATNRHLADEVEKERFNEAFYHRINAFSIEIPSLRHRKEDLPLLVDYFLTTLSPDNTTYHIVERAKACILRYNWPGNIRELRNVIERSIILAENGIITERCLPRELVESSESSGAALTLESVEREHILKMLDFYGGNRQKTADTLGISRKTLYRKLTQYAIE